jgi:hypothetical protein
VSPRYCRRGSVLRNTGGRGLIGRIDNHKSLFLGCRRSWASTYAGGVTIFSARPTWYQPAGGRLLSSCVCQMLFGHHSLVRPRQSQCFRDQRSLCLPVIPIGEGRATPCAWQRVDRVIPTGAGRRVLLEMVFPRSYSILTLSLRHQGDVVPIPVRIVVSRRHGENRS